MQLELKQYYYPATDLDLTVLSLISCTSGFALTQIDTAAIAPAFSRDHRILFLCSCVLVFLCSGAGIFDDKQLNQLRAGAGWSLQVSTTGKYFTDQTLATRLILTILTQGSCHSYVGSTERDIAHFGYGACYAFRGFIS